MVAPWLTKISSVPRKVDPADCDPVVENQGVGSGAPATVDIPAVDEPVPSPAVLDMLSRNEPDIRKLLKPQLVELVLARGLDPAGCTKVQLIQLLEG